MNSHEEVDTPSERATVGLDVLPEREPGLIFAVQDLYGWIDRDVDLLEISIVLAVRRHGVCGKGLAVGEGEGEAGIGLREKGRD